MWIALVLLGLTSAGFGPPALPRLLAVCSFLQLDLVPHAQGLATLYFRGRVDEKYFSNPYRGSSMFHCLRSCRNGRKRCFVARNRRTRKCYQVSFPVQILQWFKKANVVDDRKWNMAYRDWTTTLLRKKPAILWLYDKISQGRNFGSLGQILNIPVGNTVWTADAKGPVPKSTLLYAAGNDLEKVSLLRRGSLLLNLASYLTISMWIKLDKDAEGPMMLLGGEPWYATRFMIPRLVPHPYVRKLMLCFTNQTTNVNASIANAKNHASTTCADGNATEWRHVAVVFQPGVGTTFYVNGTQLRKNADTPLGVERVNPTHIAMWRSVNGSHNDAFKGKIACVAVFSTALSQLEVITMKDNCP